MRRSLSILLLVVAAGAAALYWQPAEQQPVEPEPKSAATPSLQIRHDLSASFSPIVRVNLTPTPAKRVRLTVTGGYVVRPVGSERVLGRGDRLDEVDVTPTPIGFRIGQSEYRVSRVEVVPDASPDVWVNDRKYRGTVRLYRRPGKKLLAVNAVRLEDYVASVVDGEMPLKFPDAARRAQAIVSRTYALYQMGNASQSSLFDLYATTRSQKYLGVEYRDAAGRRLAGESANSRQMALETAGSVCRWRGEIFCTYYSAVCGGRTTAGTDVFTDAVEPLQSVACDHCRTARFYRWTTRLSRTEAETRLQRYFRGRGRPFESFVSIRPAPGKTASIPYFEVSDGRHRHRIAATVLRRRFPSAVVHSPRFAVTMAGDELVFEGRGHGHGVGLCQWGARGLAESGKNCLEIIAYYYPGSQVVVVDSATL